MARFGRPLRGLTANGPVCKAVDLAVEVHFFGMKAKANARPSNFAGYVLAHGKRIGSEARR